MGPVTAAFEKRFAEYIGVTYAYAVTNGTAALHLAHLALGAGPGDAIICPSLTFVATANAIRYTGAMPVFADITSQDDLNVSADDIASKINARTKGICVVHYGGHPCDMTSIMRVARAHNLYVVEDAAHAPGAACWMQAEQAGDIMAPEQKVLRKCGSIGDIGCFSFFSNKNMATGEGGMITTNSDELAEKLKLLRSHGMTSLTWDRERGHSFSYDVVGLGYNYRIDEIRASIGQIQLNKIDDNNAKRAIATNIYKELLDDCNQISYPFSNAQNISSYHLFPILLCKNVERKKFMQFMKSKGIQTSIHYPPIHTFTDFKSNYQNCKLPYTEDVAKRLVTLPLFPNIHNNQIQYTVESIKDYFVKKN
jgi:dTDP-4-amino-4,6-dideoxygalactose transaminase